MAGGYIIQGLVAIIFCRLDRKLPPIVRLATENTSLNAAASPPSGQFEEHLVGFLHGCAAGVGGDLLEAEIGGVFDGGEGAGLGVGVAVGAGVERGEIVDAGAVDAGDEGGDRRVLQRQAAHGLFEAGIEIGDEAVEVVELAGGEIVALGRLDQGVGGGGAPAFGEADEKGLGGGEVGVERALGLAGAAAHGLDGQPGRTVLDQGGKTEVEPVGAMKPRRPWRGGWDGGGHRRAPVGAKQTMADGWERRITRKMPRNCRSEARTGAEGLCQARQFRAARQRRREGPDGRCRALPRAGMGTGGAVVAAVAQGVIPSGLENDR